MPDDSNAITTKEHWNAVWSNSPRMRLPSPFNLSVRNAQRLLRNHVKPGMRFLEIGCAPGKMLAWVAKTLGASVAGLDYSKNGMKFADELFKTLSIQGDLRCEDIFNNSFEPHSFDIVYSCGFIEHFADPRQIVRQHVKLLRPGGKALITIPNLTGWYAKPVKRLDPEALSMHNQEIMNPVGLRAVAPMDMVDDVRAYRSGRISVNHALSSRKLSQGVRLTIGRIVDMIAFFQPFDISFLCPVLVLEMTRKAASDE